MTQTSAAIRTGGGASDAAETGRAGNAGTASRAGKVVVTDETFAEVVLGSDVPVLVDFWAAWCPPCRMISPILDEIAAEYAGRLTVATIDVDAEPKTTLAAKILGMPTLQVYRGGQLVRSLVGARSKSRLLSELADVL